MTAWMERMACRDEDPELFFPLGEGRGCQQQIEDAKWICSLCPVRTQCLDLALKTKAVGIFAGTDEEDRRKLRRRLSRQRARA